MLNIVTDSTSDLGADLAAEFGLGVVPLLVSIGGQVYRDGVDIDQKKLFALVAKHGELPKTAAPSVGEFTRIFDCPDETVFIGISSKLSATVQNARLAAGMMPAGKVRVIDSLNLSSGVGLLALRAVELGRQGMQAGQIELALKSLTTRIQTSFVIDTMEYLRKGGRCTALQALAGSVLKIHPIIEVRPDGTLGVKAKVHGTLQKGLQMILDDFHSHLKVLDPRRVFVTTTSEDEQDVQFLVEAVRRMSAPEEIRVTRAGSVIASHCGPGTTGILYLIR